MRKCTDSLVSIEENKRKAVFQNRQREDIYIIHVDGKMITQGERADYIVAKPQVVDIIIELKGSDVTKAINQIRATLPAWQQTPHAGKKQAALVVRGKGVHPNALINYGRWKAELRKKNVRLRIETSNQTYEFGEFL